MTSAGLSYALPRKYMLTPPQVSCVTLTQVIGDVHGMSFTEARNVILSIYKDCVRTWTTLTEDEFLAADIVTKISKIGD